MKKLYRIILTTLILLLPFRIVYAQENIDSIKIVKLENKISSLEKRLTQLERMVYQKMAREKGLDTLNAGLRVKAKERMKKDSDRFPVEQIKEAEDLYQKGSDLIKTPEGKKYFDELISKYPMMNRSGCAALYIAQNEKGPGKEKLLISVIDKYSDCFYLDGVQVGAYARFFLGEFYFENKNLKKGQEQYDFIKANYPDAIDHQGKKLLLERKD